MKGLKSADLSSQLSSSRMCFYINALGLGWLKVHNKFYTGITNRLNKNNIDTERQIKIDVRSK